MTDYISTIGLPGQTGYDYTDLQTWMLAADSGDYVDGDRIIAKLTNTTVGATTQYHRLRFQIGSLGQWSTSASVEVIVSGTNSNRETPFVEPWCLNNSITYMTSDDTGEKTYKFIDIDVSNTQRLRMNSVNGRGTDAVLANMYVDWSGCRIIQDNSIAFMEDFAGDFSSVSSTATSTTVTFTNCSLYAKNQNLYRGHPTLYQVFFSKVNVIGCSIINTDDRNPVFNMQSVDSPSGFWQVCVSGSVYDTSADSDAGKEALAYRDPSRFWHHAGSAIDYISSETTSQLSNWAGTNLINASSTIPINYGTAPAVEEVSFSALYDVTGPTYALGDVVDHRLYNDSNNLAFGFATNVTLPSPDLGGTDRGVAPFDAGAFEFNINSGGSDVTASFGNVYVRLY